MTTAKHGNYTSKTVALSTVEAEVLTAVLKRKGLVMFNQGPGVARWYFTDAAAYFEMAAGTGITLADTPQNTINAVSDTTAVLTVMVSE